MLRLAVIACCAPLCTAQIAADPDSELDRIKAKVNQVVAGIPNYTCVENVERSRRLGRSGHFGSPDRVRIEVAEAGGKELFAPLGAKHFGNNGLPPAGSGSVVSNGEFVQYLRAIFGNTATQFQNRGKEDLEGAPGLRYDYIVPQRASDFRISRLGKSSFVGFHGSVWVDAESLDLARLEIVADQIPAELGVVSATTDIVYAPFRIGENRFLLPQTSALVTVTNEAYDFRNDTEFTHCRQYAGTSSISFDDPDQSKTEVLDERDLVAGMHLKLALASPLDLQLARAGDPLAALVTADVDWKGRVLIPAGARILGRIRRIKKNADQPRRIVVTLEFSEIESTTFRSLLCGVAECPFESGPLANRSRRAPGWSGHSDRGVRPAQKHHRKQPADDLGNCGGQIGARNQSNFKPCASSCFFNGSSLSLWSGMVVSTTGWFMVHMSSSISSGRTYVPIRAPKPRARQTNTLHNRVPISLPQSPDAQKSAAREHC